MLVAMHGRKLVMCDGCHVAKVCHRLFLRNKLSVRHQGMSLLEWLAGDGLDE